MSDSEIGCRRRRKEREQDGADGEGGVQRNYRAGRCPTSWSDLPTTQGVLEDVVIERLWILYIGFGEAS